jgi:hypothetical protein
MLYRLARALQLIGLLLLPMSMALQLHGMPLRSMLAMAAAGAGVFYLGYLLQERVRR